MKILLVNKFLYRRGGSESYMLAIGEYLAARGHEVQYFGMADEKNIVGNRAGAYTQNMDFHAKRAARFLYPFKIIYSVEAKRKIGRVLDDMKPDVVHLNNINFQLTPSIIDAAKKRHIPVIWTLHDYQLICPGHLLYNSNCGAICEKCVGGSKLPCIRNRCIHSSTAKSILGVIEALFYKIKGTYKKVDLFIAPSHFLYSKVAEDNRALFENRTVVLHNFVNKKKCPADAKSNFDFPYIAFAGRLSEEKGTHILRDVAKLLPSVQFVVMGGGTDKALLADIPNVHLTGFATGWELNTNLAMAEAVAVPSVCYENCPMSILEAQMLGVPCVTMPMGGMAELVEDGKTGILAKSPSAAAFADAIRDILSDKERLTAMKQNCIKASAEFLTLDDYCGRLLELYSEMMQHG